MYARDSLRSSQIKIPSPYQIRSRVGVGPAYMHPRLNRRLRCKTPGACNVHLPSLAALLCRTLSPLWIDALTLAT